MLGWRYSTISSIGTAPFNHTVSLLPARDETEFKHFLPADQQGLRDWMDWTDTHRELLKKLRSIIGPPVIGRIDGTAAIAGNHGFVFLYNPNYRERNAEFTLDAAIGLTSGDAFVLRELHPRKGTLLGKPGAGLWRRRDKVVLPIKGPEALVLELVPANDIKRPALLGAAGTVEMTGTELHLSQVSGPVGHSCELTVLMPPGKAVSKLVVNGKAATSFQTHAEGVTLPVTFAGTRFDHCPQIGTLKPGFAESTYRAELRIPKRVFEQLERRRKSWPVPYTGEELLATWRGSDRLLLIIQIADPMDTSNVGLKIGARTAEVRKAYSDVYPLGREMTFTGSYADLSDLAADTPLQLEVSFPAGLKPGQFPGLFLENVETEFTTSLAP